MWTTVESTNGGISLIGKAGVLKTPSNHVKVMCRFESDFLLYQINEIMSYGKKWFKTLEGKISMRFAMSREIWYWD